MKPDQAHSVTCYLPSWLLKPSSYAAEAAVLNSIHCLIIVTYSISSLYNPDCFVMTDDEGRRRWHYWLCIYLHSSSIGICAQLYCAWFFWRAVQKHVDFVVHSFDPKHKVKESRLEDGAVYVRWHNHRHSELRGTELTADEQNCNNHYSSLSGFR